MLTKTYDLNLQLKEQSDTPGRFSGYCSVYGVLDSDHEIIDKGAFDESIRENPVVPILYQHQKDRPIGFGKLVSDSYGLKVTEGDLMLDTPDGKLAYSWMKAAKRAAFKIGMSVGFNVKPNGSYYRDGQKHFSKLRLFEFSLVTWGACAPATVDAFKRTKDPELEAVIEVLREARRKLDALTFSTKQTNTKAEKELLALLRTRPN